MADNLIRLTREQLAKFLPDSRSIKAFEQLFQASTSDVPADITILTRNVQDVEVLAANAYSQSEPIIGSGTVSQYWRGDKVWSNLTTDINALLKSPGPIGSITPNTGAFTTLSASSTVSGAGFTAYLASPPPIGGTSANLGTFSTLVSAGSFAGPGAAGAPCYAFAGAFFTDGIYGASPGIGFAVAGTSVGTMTATGLNNMAVGATTATTGRFTTIGATSLVMTNSPGTDYSIDGTNCTIVVPNGANSAFAVGAGLIMVVAQNAGNDVGLYSVGGGAVGLITAANRWVATTTTPAAGKLSIAYDGIANYRVYNNSGGSVTIGVVLIRGNNGN